MKKMLTVSMPATTIREAYNLFISMSEGKNLAPATLRDYETKLAPFVDAFGDVPTEEFSKTIANDYVRILKKRDIKDTSVQSYFRPLIVFGHFMMDNGYSEPFKIVLPKAQEAVKASYSDAELKALLKKPDLKTCTFAELRTWALINFLVGTGCRIETALNVRIGDIDFNGGYIQFRKTKNKRAQLIPLSSTLAVCLKEYLRFRHGEGDDYLICNSFGEQPTVSGMQTAVKRYNKRRGVEQSGLHKFRHGFARTWIVNGGDCLKLQKVLGHRSLSMTERYVSLFADDLKTDYDDYVFLGDQVRQRQRMRK